MSTVSLCQTLAVSELDAPEPPHSEIRPRSVPPLASITYEQAVSECGNLVRYLARSFARVYGDFDDLVQEGWLAVLSIASRWRAELGTFTSFAYMRVRGHLSKVVARARRRGMTATKGGGHLKDMVTLSLDAELDGRTMHEELGEDAKQEEALSNARERSALRGAIETLGERDRKVVAMLDDGATIDQIDAVLGLSSCKAIPKIHEHLRCAVFGGTPPKRNKAGNVEHDGRSLSVAEWAEESGIAYGTLQMRLHRGLTMAEALSKPLRRPRRVDRLSS